MMEADQEQRFTCKFCNKTFVNGKSLGGHMRGHLALISAQKTQEIDNGDTGFEGYGLRQSHKKPLKKTEQHDDDHEEEKNNASMGSEDGYGLRENPKKSWRASGSKPNVVMVKENVNVCKDCGKGFPSMRALSGHMRCHSIKSKEENICKKCGKGFDSIRALFGHMRSHSKRSAEIEIKSDYKPPFAIPKKRLRTRYKITSNPSSSSNLNASSSSVVTDTNEVEEVAMCLMMLSRGVKNWDDFNSVNNNSSDNDSVILEAQSSLKNWDDYDGGDDDEEKEKEEPLVKLDSCVSSGPTNALIIKNFSEFCLLDSGSAIDDENKAEPGVSVDDSLSCDEKLKNRKQGSEFLAEFANDIGYPSDEPKFNGHDLDLGENCFKFLNNSESKNEYSCKTCEKIFSSRRALGGHRASHKTVITSIQTNLLTNFEANFEVEKNLQLINEIPVDQEASEVKNKEHECSICFKVFATGQALGGHKRAHYIELTDQTKAKEAVLINEELPNNIRNKNLFDLNVPLSFEDGVASDTGFKLWSTLINTVI